MNAIKPKWNKVENSGHSNFDTFVMNTPVGCIIMTREYTTGFATEQLTGVWYDPKLEIFTNQEQENL